MTSVPLLSLRHTSAQLTAGIAGSSVRVRTLDDVSLAVSPGELVLLRGRAGSGAVALARVLARPPQLPPGVRVRRAAVDEGAARAIVSWWQRSSGERDERCAFRRGVRTVYVLRVREGGGGGGGDGCDGCGARPDAALAWRAWSEIVRREGSAVVLVEAPGRALTSGPGEAAVTEHVASAVERGVARVFERPELVTPPAVRVVTMAAGRIAESFSLPATLASGA